LRLTAGGRDSKSSAIIGEDIIIIAVVVVTVVAVPIEERLGKLGLGRNRGTERMTSSRQTTTKRAFNPRELQIIYSCADAAFTTKYREMSYM
jgi:hypothetical protein